MGFCGSKTNALSVTTGVLSNDCFVDVLNIIPHVIFFLISIPIIVAWSHSVIGKINIVTWVHFQGHTLRWILTIVLFWLNIFEVMEGILSDALDPDSTNFHVFIPQCIATVCTVLSITFYHHVEMWNSPRFLLLLMLYWASALACKVLKFVSLTRIDEDLSDLRFWLTVFVIVFYCLLLLIELNVFRIQRYALFKKRNILQPLDEIADTRYDYSYVNFLSKATFWWILGLLREGYKHILELHHLGRLPVSEHTKTNMNKLHLAFEAEKVRANNQGRQPSFTRSYLRAFWPMLGLAAVYRLLGDAMGFVGPWLIENIVTFAYTARNLHVSAPANVTNATAGETYVHVNRFFNNGYVLSVVLFLSCVLQKAFLQSHHYLVIRQAVRLRNAVQGMLYEKSLKLSTLMLSSGQLSVGQILNFMSTDAVFVHNLFFFIHYIWATPIQIAVAFVLIYLKLGISAVIGGIIVVLVLPFQYLVARGLSKIQKKILVCTDERMKLATELIQGIRPLKQFVWEKLFSGRVETARRKEMKHVFRHAVLLAFVDFITVGTPIIGMLVTFSLYTVLEEEPLTAGKVFSTVALFNVLLLPLFTLTIVIHAIVNARVSSQRLLPFFLAPEVEGLKLHDAYVASEAVQCGDGEAKVQLSDDFSVKFFPGLPKNKSRTGRKSQSSFQEGNSDETSPMTRKYSAPPRMMTHVTQPLLANDHTKSVSKSSDSSQKSKSSNEIAADTDIRISPCRKSQSPSQESSNSSLDKCELLPAMENDRQPPKSISCSVSTEDMAEMSGSETVIEIRHSIEVNKGSFSWDLENKEPCLRNISLKIPTGKLTVVIGAVGSGKSSLLSAILGEMMTLSGTVDWARESKPAYVAQKPWILNTSLRENILLGQPLVWKKYKRVLHACALNSDLEILPSGDLTEIGEKGINLSGGQKQRVNLARAMYADVNTVLLDDPLSALDSHVSRHVFDAAIMRRLVNKKHTVVLVTHSVQYLSRASQIIVMKDGQIHHQGRLSDIKKVDKDLYESWRLKLREVKKKEESEHKASKCVDHVPLALIKSDGAVKVASHLNPDHESLSRRSSVQSQMSSKLLSVASGRQLSKLSIMTEASSDDEVEMDRDNTTGQLIPEEARETGAVSWGVYIVFARACTFWLTAIVIAVNVAKHSLVVAADFWLSQWAGQSVIYNATTVTQQVSHVDNWYYLKIYFVMCMCAVFLSLAASLFQQFTVVKAAKSLHHQLLHNIILAPVRFFDITPSGRILNRFSGDTSVIDLKVGQSLSHLLRSLLNCVTGAIVIVISTAYLLIFIIPITILYFIMQRFYLATSRELQRLESLTKSPVFSHFSETLNGLQTIRAYRLQKLFLKTALAHIDNNTVPLLFLHTVNRFVGVFLDSIGSVIVLAAAVGSLTSAIYGDSDPAFVGISIAYALLMCDSLNWMIRRASEVELQMNAMERIKEYSEVTQEPYDMPGCAELDDNWPRKGEIQFKNVSARYAEGLDMVLKGITLTIKAGEKIGLCGRTGSGKTSLSLSLFRMVDVAEGEISIDGQNITLIPLSRLRSAITAIPQDPLLFYGSVRYNLDPEETASDADIWQALEMAQLKDTVDGMAQKLDSPITEGGENFSVGQRQLFCFARALLRHSQILVLDEATASVDMATDQLIQSVIAKAFVDKTVLTVAHRISTIESYDRVIVLDDGHLAELDSPANLLQNPDSLFYKLAKENKM